MPIFQQADTQLFYQITGEGEPCLVLHGGLGLDHTYMRMHDNLAGLFRLVYYDHRSNGSSGRPPIESMTFESLCADADALREHVGTDKVALLANSYGAGIALQYAVRYPARVSRLILTGASACFSAAQFADRARAKGGTDEELALFLSPATDDIDLAQKFTALLPVYFGKHYNPAIHRPIAERITYCLAALGRSFEILGEHDLRQRLAEIKAPVLIVAGAHDYVAPLEEARLLASGLPDASLVVFDQSGHFPFIEEPERFRQVVIDWLGGTRHA